MLQGRVTNREAAGALGLSVRQFRRIRARYRVAGVEGLLHISELGNAVNDRSLRHARDAVKPGDELEVAVLSVDREKRRISLGRASGEERIDDAGRAAVARGASAGMGTFGDLLKTKLSGR